MDLRCIGIEKTFGSNRALAGANMTVRSGTIHALLGENGAGKSTLNNVISGALVPDSGTLQIGSQIAKFRSPLEAAAAGIGMVHQHFLLADALTVAENIALGNRSSAGGVYFNRKAAAEVTDKLAESSGLQVDPNARVADLSVGMRQRVEILKALSRGAQILLLDEPTAVLAPNEVTRLFETLSSLRDQGRTIVIVTHKLDEVFALADAVTVLRRGATVFEGQLSSTNPAALTREMIGRAPPDLFVSETARESQTQAAKTIFEMSDVEPPGELRVERLMIGAGEIVGVAGVEGNGQEELSGFITGNYFPYSGIGTLKLEGRDLRPLNIRERSEAGIAFIPPDRQREGLVLEFSLAENIFLRDPIQSKRFALLPELDLNRMNSETQILLSKFGVVPPEASLSASALSGGNQQKVVAARELKAMPRLIVACNPTRGLDVGATVDLQNKLIDAARKQNAAVLLISSDLDEVLALSDRVCALYKGRLSEVGARGVSRDDVGRAMVGASMVTEVVEARS